MNTDARRIAAAYHNLRTLAHRDEAKAITVRADELRAILNAYRAQKMLLMRLLKSHALQGSGWLAAIGEVLTDKASDEQPALTAFFNVYDSKFLRHESVASAQNNRLYKMSGGRCIEVCFYGDSDGGLLAEARVVERWEQPPADPEK